MNIDDVVNHSLLLERCVTNRFGTFGHLIYDDEVICDTLEPVKCDNTRRHGIPEGKFEVEYTYSNKFGVPLPLIKVPGRIGIRIHAGNWSAETQGCILVGTNINFKHLKDSQKALSLVCRIVREQRINYIVVYSSTPDLQKEFNYE